jgi:hypothetical protein
MRDLSAAKWSYVTRRIPDRANWQLGPIAVPALGDLVLASVSAVGAHDRLENVHGRRVQLHPGDLLVGAYGNRYACDFYEGYLPFAYSDTHLLTSGGVIGTVASSHADRREPTQLTILGSLGDATGQLSLDRFALPIRGSARRQRETLPPTIVVVGSSMNAGKTTTAAAMVRGWTKAGLAAAAGKVTGSGSGKDRWSYVDAGAISVVDFLDFGMASTFGYPAERLHATMLAIRDELAAEGAAVIVLEIADGILQEETRRLAASLPDFADRVVLAVADALSATSGVELLAAMDVPVAALSGRVSASPLASREAAAATGLQVLSPHELVAGAALDLISGLRIPT